MRATCSGYRRIRALMICFIVGTWRCLRIPFIAVYSNLQSPFETLTSHRTHLWRMLEGFAVCPGISSPSSDINWNLHIRLLASPRIDIFVEENVVRHHESSCMNSSSNSGVNIGALLKVGRDLRPKWQREMKLPLS
jgi:hypothetical protein